jgi:hypothetical protein
MNKLVLLAGHASPSAPPPNTVAPFNNYKSKNNGLARNRTLDHSQAYPEADAMLSEYYTTKPQARRTLLDEKHYKTAIFIPEPYFESSRPHLESKNSCLVSDMRAIGESRDRS